MATVKIYGVDVMTWATIHYLSESTMAVEFGYAERQKNAIAAMPGAEWDKSSKRWLVPVARLGEIVKLFWPLVTIDYMVLRARDHALVRMFAGYMAMGVRFDVSNGKVVCDHAVLNEWFAANSTVLHVNALQTAQRGPVCVPRSYPTATPLPPNGDNPGKPSKALEPAQAKRRDAKGADLELWLKGSLNAAKREEAKGEMLKRKRLAQNRID